MTPTALTLLLLTQAGAAATPDAVYRLTLDAELSRASIEFCVDRWPEPPRLLSQQKEAEGFRSPARVTRGRAEIVEGRRGISLRNVADGSCVEYDVDLDRLEREGGERALRRVGNSVFTNSGLWLWRPESDDEGRELHIELHLPAGVEASVPWPPLAPSAAADPPRFRLTPTPRDWNDLTAFGELSYSELDVPGARLRLAIADTSPPANAADVAAWIDEAARAVGTLYGRFPLPDAQVVVVPIGRRGEAVPWAQVQRGGGPSAHFYIDQFRPLTEFREDWTATHELSHMLLPYVSRRDAWLSEGFASYYQNVLRARAGMITPEQAWQKLYAGFERGRQGTRGDTLAEVSRDMHRRGAFMRVYWSGAAVALLADVELREQSGGSQSLDLALQRLADCCLPSHRTWTAREVLTRLDTLMETDLFVGLYERHKNARQFPDVAMASAALGILERDGRLRFESGPEESALRRAIMTTPAAVLADGTDTDTSHAPQPESTTRTGDSGSPRRTAP